MNKKAAVSAIIADIYAFLVFGIVAIAFFAVLKLGFGGHAEYTVESKEILIAPQVTLQSYLRAYVTFQGKEISVAELIAWSFNNNNYTRLDEITKEIFRDFDYYEIFICDAIAYDICLDLPMCTDPTVCPHRIANGRKTILPVMQRIANIKLYERPMHIEMRIE